MSPSQADLDRFLRFVDKLPNGCWFWSGARSRGQGNRKWYGSFWVCNRVVRAHKFAFQFLGDQEWISGYHLDHTCSFSLCVNPAHLELVTREVNQVRKMQRRYPSPTEFHHASP